MSICISVILSPLRDKSCWIVPFTIYFTAAKQVQIACSSYKKAVECCNLVFNTLDSAWDSPDQVSILGIFISAWSPQAPVTVTGEKS